MATATGTRITKTPQGDARVHLHPAADARGALVLGHGAGGGVEAPDLVAATAAAVAQGFSVALVEQPYRVAGKRSSPAGAAARRGVDRGRRDLRGDELDGPAARRRWPLGGRPRGLPHGGGDRRGRRALPGLPAPAAGARRQGAEPEPPAGARRREVPMLIVQGESDRFGMPEPGPNREVVVGEGRPQFAQRPRSGQHCCGEVAREARLSGRPRDRAGACSPVAATGHR